MTSLWLITAFPIVCALVSLVVSRPKRILALCVVGSLAEVAIAVPYIRAGMASRVFSIEHQLMLDPLSSYHLSLVVTVFALASIYANGYFSPEIARGKLALGKARRFGVAWFGFLASMTLMLVANNIALMWIAMEGTTLASAVLVCLEFDRPSVKAAWAYLLICSLGIALALLGTFILCGEAKTIAGPDESAFLWTSLSVLAPRMRPDRAQFAFIFLLVGYGTKAGLAPMHTWLPAAHSQAPTPVSAVLSGVLLNCAIYCITRFVPIVSASSGFAWISNLLVPFGLLSIIVAAVFIVHEHDVKRLLAYHSVEHMGIIALGLGIGAGSAAMYHMLGHTLCKMQTFFCAGMLVQRYGTRDMSRMHRILSVSPIAGAGIVLGILALIGVPPFSIFMSELWIVVAGAKNGHMLAVIVFFSGASVVFIAALKHAVEMVWSGPNDVSLPEQRPAASTGLLVIAPLVVLAILGCWMPPALRAAIDNAASVIGY